MISDKAGQSNGVDTNHVICHRPFPVPDPSLCMIVAPNEPDDHEQYESSNHCPFDGYRSLYIHYLNALLLDLEGLNSRWSNSNRNLAPRPHRQRYMSVSSFSGTPLQLDSCTVTTQRCLGVLELPAVSKVLRP